MPGSTLRLGITNMMLVDIGNKTPDGQNHRNHLHSIHLVLEESNRKEGNDGEPENTDGVREEGGCEEYQAD